MAKLNKFIFVLFVLLAIWFVVAQDFTPSIFERDDASIPLNPDDPTFDLWSQLRDTSDDPAREPGPIFPGRLRNPGVQSFFQLPIAINQQDLIAGEVDVAILGAEIDMGVGMRGAGEGPNALRSNLGIGGG
ncbi:MAG: hypothetical protein MI746_04405, partial [Pseudomonadales bacterium]|nr:hypothetical protein [Pseudomonadales bacterium]